MKIITKKIKVYKFNELSEDIQNGIAYDIGSE